MGVAQSRAMGPATAQSPIPSSLTGPGPEERKRAKAPSRGCAPIRVRECLLQALNDLLASRSLLLCGHCNCGALLRASHRDIVMLPSLPDLNIQRRGQFIVLPLALLLACSLF